MEINREELAWVAGFFDGEGCASSNDNEPPRLRVNNTDRDLLERMQNALGGLGNIRGPYNYEGAKQDGANRKPLWRFSLRRFEESQAAAAIMWPFLGDVKKRDIREAFKEYEEFRNRDDYGKKWKNGTCMKGHDITKEENVYHYPDRNVRKCRVCARIRQRERRREKREADNS